MFVHLVIRLCGMWHECKKKKKEEKQRKNMWMNGWEWIPSAIDFKNKAQMDH